MPNFDIATPYAAAYVILRRSNKVAMILRTNTGFMDGKYGLPSGKVEHNETFSQAAVREAYEEVGVTIKPEHIKHVMTVHRKASDDTIVWVDLYFEASEWVGELINGEPEKHGDAVWMDLDNLSENVIPYIAKVLRDIEAGGTYGEFGWDD